MLFSFPRLSAKYKTSAFVSDTIETAEEKKAAEAEKKAKKEAAEAEKKAAEAEKYAAKLIGYRRVGFDLVPQPQKYTGFELVKDYFEEQTGDGWAFEKQFRNPLSKMNEGIYNKDPHQYRVKLSDGQQKALDTIYLKHFPSSDWPSARIRI